MKYWNRPTECEAMQWRPVNGKDVANTDVLLARSMRIVAWVNANGGEARYEPYEPIRHDDGGFGPRIAVLTAGGERHMKPGWYAVRYERAWSVCDPETFERRWEPAP